MMQRPPKIASLQLSRFMSWPKADLVLSPGLNVVVGPSDSGKTNLYRSLRAIVENAPADRVVSIGNSEGSAGVIFDDGREVVLTKGTGKAGENSYSVMDPSGSRRFDKVGADCPVEVSNVLRLGPVDLSGIETDIHFSSQRGPAFGVDAKPADLAKIIGSVCGLDVVYVALANAEKNRKSTAAEDARATTAFEKARAKYRAAEESLSATSAITLQNSLMEMQREYDRETAEARDLVLMAPELVGSAKIASVYESAARKVSEKIDSVREDADNIREIHEEARDLRSIADELRDISVDLSEVIENEAAIVTVCAKLHDAVAEEAKKKCPLCGRKG